MASFAMVEETYVTRDVDLVSTGGEILARKHFGEGAEEVDDKGRRVREHESQLASWGLVCLYPHSANVLIAIKSGGIT